MRWNTPALAGFALAAILPSAVSGQVLTEDGRLVYPEGSRIPASMTPLEKKWVAENGLGGSGRAVTPPPDGPVWCPGEYAPMDGILIAWEGWSSQIDAILTSIGMNVTTIGDADLYVACDNATDVTNATTKLAAAGTDMARVHTFIRRTDTIWIRDYGPRYIYLGDCRAVVDHTYNRPRPNDDVLPVFFAGNVKHHDFYEHALIHGGGNYHLDSVGRSYCTRLIVNENPGRSEQEIHDIWESYQNVDTHFFDPFRQLVDSTQHIDMWVQVVGDDKVVVSDWPNDSGSVEDVICDDAAVLFASRGYEVHRVPARSISEFGGLTHYTYTNVVMCNDLVLVPSYTNAQVTQHNAQAEAAWQAACPDKTVVMVNCQAIVTSAGVMHCIVMHVPKHLGGVNPTAYLKAPRGGESFDPGEQVEIRWITDDDQAVSTVDILLSTDGGVNFDVVVAAGVADSWTFNWTVPDVHAPNARIRVVARDADGNSGFDDSDADFAINGDAGCAADVDGNGLLNIFDFLAFQTYYSEEDARADLAPPFGTFNIFDFLAFQTYFGEGC